MPRISNVLRAVVGSCVLLAGCGERLPTGTGGDLFPAGGRPTTVAITAPAESFALLGRYAGYTGPQDAAFLLVANRFDGALDASTLARFRNFPTFVSVTVNGTTQVDSVFSYLGGQIVVPIDTVASEFAGPVTLELLALAVSPGGDEVFGRNGVNASGARLISSVRILPGAPASWDSAFFNVDSLTVRQFLRADFPGLLIRATESSGRLQLGRLSLETRVRPSQRPDTTIAQSITGGPQTFVYSSEPPVPANALVAGGVRSARSVFRITLPERVPAAAGDSRTVPIDSVTINEAALIFEPLPVAGGWRPLGPVPLQLLQVVEPALGARAPLGDVVQDPAGFDQFGALYAPILYTPGESGQVVARLSQHIRSVAARDTTARRRDGLATTLALIGGSDVTTFGRAEFRLPPQLRLVYTVPAPSAQR